MSLTAINADNFAAEVKESDVPVLVDFWAEWCSPCNMLTPVLEQIAEEKGDSIKIVKANLDENQALATEFGVKSIPTLIYFKGGEAQDTDVGVQPKDAIVSKLEALV